MMKITNEDLMSLIECQLESWSLARDNFHNLSAVRSRRMNLGDFHIRLQCNPARIKSTGAAIDKNAISERPCFLCGGNRPKEQMAAEIIPGWELLVNPYPIFPMHFTLPSTRHIPQDQMPLEMAQMTEMMPGMAIFFNGAKAGASAPDHLHCQAVLKEELPIIDMAENFHRDTDRPFMLSSDFGLNLPFIFVSAIVTPDIYGMRTLNTLPEITGVSADGSLDHGLKNVILWIDNSSMLRAVIIPRRAHRPSCYFAEGDQKHLVSPGAIDMAGVVILPRPEDFDSLTESDLWTIYNETAYQNSLPPLTLSAML